MIAEFLKDKIDCKASKSIEVYLNIKLSILFLLEKQLAKNLLRKFQNDKLAKLASK